MILFDIRFSQYYSRQIISIFIMKIFGIEIYIGFPPEYEDIYEKKIKGPDNPTCVFFRKSVAMDTIGSLSKGTSECASVSQ